MKTQSSSGGRSKKVGKHKIKSRRRKRNGGGVRSENV